MFECIVGLIVIIDTDIVNLANDTAFKVHLLYVSSVIILFLIVRLYGITGDITTITCEHID